MGVRWWVDRCWRGERCCRRSTVTDGPFAGKQTFIGGFAVVDVPSREQAHEWAAKFAVACRCAQEVRAFVAEPQM